MRNLFTKATIWIAFLISATSFTACSEDWWYGSDDDMWITDNLIGAWRIVEAYESQPGDCPYQRNDIMEFFRDGTMRTTGYELNEGGYWRVRNQEIEIDFNGDHRADCYAYIELMDEGYMVLNVKDYIYNHVARYELRMVRYY